MQYISTRNKKITASSPQAIVKGLADDGGLFVPLKFPSMSRADFDTLLELDYAGRAEFIMAKFLPELKSDLAEFTKNAYSKFDDDDASPLIKVDDGLYFLELWHGPTYAFKDVALTILPLLLAKSKELVGDSYKTLILVATSGDTGKAALEGFKDANGINVLVLYPTDGVSNLQKLQMQTTTGGNVKVLGLHGNFDDAQSAVKDIFGDSKLTEELKRNNINLSSANSINIGRLIPQVAYYFSAYADMIDSGNIKFGDKVNFCVPTGNFGNILAGYYALQMGLPIGKLVCASNKNNVLTDFFNKGTYSLKREFYKTSSPSMDILISSNLERLVFEISGRDDLLTAKRLKGLSSGGDYCLTKDEQQKLSNLFWAGFASEEEAFGALGQAFDEYGYIMDTHTAVAYSVYNDYVKATKDKTPCVIVSTASPYKFVKDVLFAIGEQPTGNDKKDIFLLEDLTALPIPETLSQLFKMPILHKDILDKEDIKDAVLKYSKEIGAKK